MSKKGYTGRSAEHSLNRRGVKTVNFTSSTGRKFTFIVPKNYKEKAIRVDIHNRWHWYRQKEPSLFKYFWKVQVNNNMYLIVGVLKEGGKPVIQAVRVRE